MSTPSLPRTTLDPVPARVWVTLASTGATGAAPTWVTVDGAVNATVSSRGTAHNVVLHAGGTVTLPTTPHTPFGWWVRPLPFTDCPACGGTGTVTPAGLCTSAKHFPVGA